MNLTKKAKKILMETKMNKKPAVINYLVKLGDFLCQIKWFELTEVKYFDVASYAGHRIHPMPFVTVVISYSNPARCFRTVV